MMKKNSHITAFYLETILLIVVFMTIILVLTNIFGGSKSISSSAKNLNKAVCLATNAAEAVAASDSPEAAAELLYGENIIINGTPAKKSFRVDYDENMNPSADGFYHVDVTWEPEKTSGGTMVSSNISVFSGTLESPVYQLKTAVFLKEENR